MNLVESSDPGHLFSRGFCTISSEQCSSTLEVGFESPAGSDFRESYGRLVQDRHMGDGGRYRFRRYSRFRLNPGESGVDWTPLEDTSIYQETADNPLNGGVTRTFAPLEPVVTTNRFFRALLTADLARARKWMPDLFSAPVLMGVHQVRISVSAGGQGRPTPEGIHRDAERLTIQHLIGREGVAGGEFRVHHQDRRVAFSWLQLNPLDSVAFLGTTWHSATPIRCQGRSTEGYRDVLLIDFDPAPGE